MVMITILDAINKNLGITPILILIIKYLFLNIPDISMKGKLVGEKLRKSER